MSQSEQESFHAHYDLRIEDHIREMERELGAMQRDPFFNPTIKPKEPINDKER